MQTFNWVFENQPITLEILTASRYIKAESNLIADEKGPIRGIQVVVWLYIYIYRFIIQINLLGRYGSPFLGKLHIFPWMVLGYFISRLLHYLG